MYHHYIPARPIGHACIVIYYLWLFHFGYQYTWLSTIMHAQTWLSMVINGIHGYMHVN